MKRDADSDLGQLADRLIVRHLRVSVPDGAVRQAIQSGRDREPLLEKHVRCVAVVGAGASSALFSRANALADELEHTFSSPEQQKRRRAELYRLARVYGLKPNDFETRLAALSHSPEITDLVRYTIASKYAYRHPTILAYELLAHLLKHRFLDAIVSFNFDELLDQSLDDELGATEYRRVLTDRDCHGLQTDPDAANYLPIYVKLHGTATEPDSLRFTREAYFALPARVTDVVQSLLECQLGVIVNVGSGMNSFDLHRLLRIPRELEVYDLSQVPLLASSQKAIDAERIGAVADSYYASEGRAPAQFVLPAHRLAKREQRTSDEWLKRLVREIGARTGSRAPAKKLSSLVRFRSVARHEAIDDVLGPKVTLSRWIDDPKKYARDYVEYLKHRTIMEMAISGAKARGLAQVSWLAVDRCGLYDDLYRRAIGDGKAEKWGVLRAAAGLDENEWLPDVVESSPALCPDDAPPTYADGQWSLREFDTAVLAEHVLHQIGESGSNTARLALTATLATLQSASEIEIVPTADRVCSKTFTSPLTLGTVTSLKIFTEQLFVGLKPQDPVYISCETGEWLLSDDPICMALERQEHVEVITAFDLRADALQERYGGRLRQRVIGPWRHNRHMTIVAPGGVPGKAVYFARRLRTPLITPVYLERPDDVRRLKRMWDLMVHELELGVSGPVAMPATNAFDET